MPTADERGRIEIPGDVARAERVPEDLDSSLTGPYAFPSLTRRRAVAVVCLVGAVLAVGGVAAGLPRGLLVTAGILLAIAIWHLLAAWPLGVGDGEALDAATRAVDFPVGHASAAVGFEGWRARPIWNVLVFSADEPPSQRGLVRIDAVDGTVVESFVEANPEV